MSTWMKVFAIPIRVNPALISEVRIICLCFEFVTFTSTAKHSLIEFVVVLIRWLEVGEPPTSLLCFSHLQAEFMIKNVFAKSLAISSVRTKCSSIANSPQQGQANSCGLK